MRIVGKADGLIYSEGNIPAGRYGQSPGASPGSKSQACWTMILREPGRPGSLFHQRWEYGEQALKSEDAKRGAGSRIAA